MARVISVAFKTKDEIITRTDSYSFELDIHYKQNKDKCGRGELAPVYQATSFSDIVKDIRRGIEVFSSYIALIVLMFMRNYSDTCIKIAYILIILRRLHVMYVQLCAGTCARAIKDESHLKQRLCWKHVSRENNVCYVT